MSYLSNKHRIERPSQARRTSPNVSAEASLAREKLRKRYRPARVVILFVGESPPASGRFFYQANSGLYWAIKKTFQAVLPDLRDTDFLDCFKYVGCYLVDLCAQPVDDMPSNARRRACRDSEPRLARIIRAVCPEIIVTVIRSIGGSVRRAEELAGWSGVHVELPYPGRWQRHRTEFRRILVALLREALRPKPKTLPTSAFRPHSERRDRR